METTTVKQLLDALDEQATPKASQYTYGMVINNDPSYAKNLISMRALGEATRNQATIGELSRKAMGGDDAAFKQWAAVDPQGAQAAITAMKGWNEEQRKQADMETDLVGSAVYAVNNAPEAQRPVLWQSMRGFLKNKIKGIDSIIPETYDANTATLLIARSAGLKDLMKNNYEQQKLGLDKEQFGEVKRHNLVTEGIQSRQENRLSREGGGIGSKPNIALEKYLSDQSEMMVGGLKDGEGQIVAGKAQQANWIATRAKVLMKTQGLQPQDAVGQAYRQMNAELQKERGGAGQRKGGIVKTLSEAQLRQKYGL